MTAEAKTPLVLLYDNNVAAIIIFMISFLGTIANFTVAFFTSSLPTMNNPFGRLTASQATGEAILCAVFCLYSSPMMFSESEWMEENSKHAGWVKIICYDICIWSHLFIALNRLVAICFPIKYNIIFSMKNTKMMIIFSWFIAIVTAVFLYKLNDCDFYYSSQLWAFIFSDNPVCNFISMTVDFYKDISIVIIIAVVDLITIINVRRTNFESVTTDAQRTRRRREINFLKQAILQGIVFVVELLTYFIFAWKFQNRWAIWSMTTFAWITVHTTDGLIIILFNREFRQLVTSPLKRIHSYAGATSHNESVGVPGAVHPASVVSRETICKKDSQALSTATLDGRPTM